MHICSLLLFLKFWRLAACLDLYYMPDHVGTLRKPATVVLFSNKCSQNEVGATLIKEHGYCGMAMAVDVLGQRHRYIGLWIYWHEILMTKCITTYISTETNSKRELWFSEFWSSQPDSHSYPPRVFNTKRKRIQNIINVKNIISSMESEQKVYVPLKMWVMFCWMPTWPKKLPLNNKKTVRSNGN